MPLCSPVQRPSVSASVEIMSSLVLQWRDITWFSDTWKDLEVQLLFHRLPANSPSLAPLNFHFPLVPVFLIIDPLGILSNKLGCVFGISYIALGYRFFFFCIHKLLLHSSAFQFQNVFALIFLFILFMLMDISFLNLLCEIPFIV